MGESDGIKDILNLMVGLPSHLLLIAHVMVREYGGIKANIAYHEHLPKSYSFQIWKFGIVSWGQSWPSCYGPLPLLLCL